MSKREVLTVAFLITGCVSTDEGPTDDSLPDIERLGEGPKDPGEPGDPSEPPGTGAACSDPHVVYMRTGGGARHCSAVVLAPDLILTAAHCVVGQDLSGMTVGVGGDGCTHGTASVQNFKSNPNYGQNQGSDVALVKLSSSLAGVSPVLLSTPQLNSSITVTGFGFNMVDGQTQRCTPGTISAIAGNDITLAMGANQVCEGDSGGAVFETGSHRLVGLLTVGYPTNSGDSCATSVGGGADWAWVGATMSDMTGASHVSCTIGATKQCKLEGSECPTTGDLCKWGVSTCTNGNLWSECVPNALTVWNPDQNSCVCTQTCAPGLVQQYSTCECTNQCGNGLCQSGETTATCPADCVPLCGNGVCAVYESFESCPQDCSGGTSCVCGHDCPPNTPGCAGYCGDGQCDLVTENSTNCSADCGGSSCVCGYDCPPNTPGCSGYCGDGQCDLVTENSTTCSSDCGGSSCICGYDCPPNTPGCSGYCGDGQCDLISGENTTSCPTDCGSLGGGEGYDPCTNQYDSFWSDWFGDDAFAAYEYFCGALAN